MYKKTKKETGKNRKSTRVNEYKMHKSSIITIINPFSI